MSHYQTDRRDRVLLACTLLWCLLAVHTVLWSWPWGMGITAFVFSWYILLLMASGQRLFHNRESHILLAANLALACAFSLNGNPWFRGWNFLALLALVPLHTCGLAGTLPWSRFAMLGERLDFLLQGLFGCLGAAAAALRPSGRKQNGKRTFAILLGSAGAFVLVIFLSSLLMSADALFASVAETLEDFIDRHVSNAFIQTVTALVLTPFFFGLLYRLRHPAPAQNKNILFSLAVDPVLFLIMVAALDGLYLLFLAVQSAGLFGGADYLAQRGISYAEWARSGFFQMVFVSVVNLSVLLAALQWSRRQGQGFKLLRILGMLLTAESLLLLLSAAWRMTLYTRAYGLSFKRILTYWGMLMMTLFFLTVLGKLQKPDRSFWRTAAPLALTGWLVINCVPIDYLVAKNQVDRYLAGKSETVDVEYLLYDLSYDTLSQLERLDTSKPVGVYQPATYILAELPLSHYLTGRREQARRDCGDWRTWSLSACLVLGSGQRPTV